MAYRQAAEQRPSTPLPVEFVLHPSWWYKHAGITFDRDFYFNPLRRVEAERIMEQTLYDRWGEYGLGVDKDKDLPVVGAVHLAAGFIISEMMGCRVDYPEDGSPQVLSANGEGIVSDPVQAFHSPVFKQFTDMMESMKKQYGFLVGDVNWGGILNISLDLWGQGILLELYDDPDNAMKHFNDVSTVIDRFTSLIKHETGSTSISVNRSILNFSSALHLHSVCSLTMLSGSDYEKYLLPYDILWSRKNTLFGLHYCGPDPHRFAEVFSRIPKLDFLDIGWGADLPLLRKLLPNTFFNLRLSPVEFLSWNADTIDRNVRKLVNEAGRPDMTGVCCINIDAQVEDHQIEALLLSVKNLRTELFQDNT